MMSHVVPQPSHLPRRPRWDPIVPPKTVHPVFHEAELAPVVHLKGVLGSLPTGDLTLGLFTKLTPEGTGREEPSLETGYVRQTIGFGSRLGADTLVNLSPVTFDFRSDHRAPALVALLASGTVIMRGRFTPSQVWVGADPEDDQERQLQLTTGALRLRFH